MEIHRNNVKTASKYMKKSFFAILFLISSVSGVRAAGPEQQKFIAQCLQKAGLSQYQAECQAMTIKDAQMLQQIGLDSSFRVNFSGALTGMSWYNGVESHSDVSVPVKGLLFKKYIRLSCRENHAGELQVGGFIVDIENRVDTMLFANVKCN